MLKWMYESFGLFGSLLIYLLLFVIFIFWIAGLAGINQSREDEESKNIRLIVSVFLPPYPILWLISDIYRQHKILRGKTK